MFDDARGDQVQNTQSGRVKKRPEYLKQYEETFKMGKMADDEEGGDSYK